MEKNISPNASNCPNDADRCLETAMRTTLNIRDEVLEDIKEFAAARSISAGEATSILVERALSQSIPVRKDGYCYVFSPAGEAEPMTLEHALQIEDESE
jgi:hypothetical protein